MFACSGCNSRSAGRKLKTEDIRCCLSIIVLRIPRERGKRPEERVNLPPQTQARLVLPTMQAARFFLYKGAMEAHLERHLRNKFRSSASTPRELDTRPSQPQLTSIEKDLWRRADFKAENLDIPTGSKYLQVFSRSSGNGLCNLALCARKERRSEAHR